MPYQETPRQRFGCLFVGVARRWRAALDASLAEVGLSDATWSPLVHIGRSGGGISQKDLAARVGIDTSTLVRLLDILSAKGLIERRQDPADRRANLLYLTPEGQSMLARIQQVLDVAETRMLADWDDETMQQLTDRLEQLDQRLRAGRTQEEPA
ncbi:MarR family winged helix-turn-helix transcriptional regulator [Kerstersia gyiorum]|uniref:Transcriptional regulator n=1 Tax=Kerstersia gyiorum TaxID=206506 RepID=A0A171KTG8_9BURK|nr:MarR family winged helix-turn-helix transcriptional regulator [Kerstersia gyiorum]AZV93965.1 MarR family transcriptional regulator [Bordetella sp. J329]MCO7640351.1 MarR family winged helix-turn-helix transcriptional regulator [Pseudomonas sp. S 311-6]KAB0542919.1 winged helix-turn-helix transcriptional regulator [Kerstersia gyiorum]KKO72185.1 transcriptional regulator [Kerstersia gyiorum]MCP1633003.1 MarR family transcriptional regulator for hemolysin [Kerstersia gyiorum]